jgi:hypothetical protein
MRRRDEGGGRRRRRQGNWFVLKQVKRGGGCKGVSEGGGRKGGKQLDMQMY